MAEAMLREGGDRFVNYFIKDCRDSIQRLTDDELLKATNHKSRDEQPRLRVIWGIKDAFRVLYDGYVDHSEEMWDKEDPRTVNLTAKQLIDMFAVLIGNDEDGYVPDRNPSLMQRVNKVVEEKLLGDFIDTMDTSSNMALHPSLIQLTEAAKHLPSKS